MYCIRSTSKGKEHLEWRSLLCITDFHLISLIHAFLANKYHSPEIQVFSDNKTVQITRAITRDINALFSLQNLIMLAFHVHCLW